MAGMMRIRNGSSLENVFKLKIIPNTDFISPASGITISYSSGIALSTFMSCNICFQKSTDSPANSVFEIGKIKLGYRPTSPGFIGGANIVATVETGGAIHVRMLSSAGAGSNIWIRGIYMFNCD